MIETKLEILGVTFECQKWDDSSWDRVTINYTEHSPSPPYRDMETSVDVSKEQARQIIAFLKDAYPELNTNEGTRP